MTKIKTLQYNQNINVVCRLCDGEEISVETGYSTEGGKHVRELADDELLEIQKDQTHLHMLWAEAQ